ncbi:hypothetical protein [Pseudoxanthomonas koreensis]|uniref:hypothetical protein n=1 Tax=Pseudoxanthomonas koreensis TaxID=266061 RepID=UPI0035A6D00F
MNILLWLRQVPGSVAKRKDFEANRWWLEFLNDPAQVINPVLCAMEGWNLRVPTIGEFRTVYESSCDELQAYFPRAHILRHEAVHFDGLYELVTRTSVRHAAEVTFLRQVAPLVTEPKGGRERRRLRELILGQARNSGIRTSMALIAVLSCLCEGGGKAARVTARRVIKPTASYSEEDAHNALSDIRALEMLAAGYALGGPALGLCTRDKPLAGFWCDLGVRNSCLVEGVFATSYGLSPRLFTALSEEEMRELFSLMVDYGFDGIEE